LNQVETRTREHHLRFESTSKHVFAIKTECAAICDQKNTTWYSRKKSIPANRENNFQKNAKTIENDFDKTKKPIQSLNNAGACGK